MKWIKIEEQEPPQDSIILTYGDPSNYGVGITICSHSDGIFRYWESEKENKHTITHWKNLPKVPKEENDNDRNGQFYTQF